MNCPQCQGIETIFDEKNASKELKTYRKKGFNKTTRLLINFLKSLDIQGNTLLDIGGGIGTIQHELLKSGLSDVINVEASTAYINASKNEAERLGHKERIKFIHEDFIKVAHEVPITDIVTLDRVICCYPDMEKLVESSISRAGNYYGVVYPRDTWWMKIGFSVINLIEKVKRRKYRAFIHSKNDFHSIISKNKLKQLYFHRTKFWQIEVFERTENN
jgi:magnesium-protoporphyrin O-methyltransferase